MMIIGARATLDQRIREQSEKRSNNELGRGGSKAHALPDSSPRRQVGAQKVASDRPPFGRARMRWVRCPVTEAWWTRSITIYCAETSPTLRTTPRRTETTDATHPHRTATRSSALAPAGAKSIAAGTTSCAAAPLWKAKAFSAAAGFHRPLCAPSHRSEGPL
jgi:hypothetical protein